MASVMTSTGRKFEKIYFTPIPFPAQTRPSAHRPWSSPLRSARDAWPTWIRQTLTTLYDSFEFSVRFPSESVYGENCSHSLEMISKRRTAGCENKLIDVFPNGIAGLYLRKREIDRTKNWVAHVATGLSKDITDTEMSKEFIRALICWRPRSNKIKWQDDEWRSRNESKMRTYHFDLKGVAYRIQKTCCFDSRALPLLEVDAKKNNDKIISLKRNRLPV